MKTQENKTLDKTESTYFSIFWSLVFSFFITLSIVWPSSIPQFNFFLTNNWYYYYFIGVFSASFGLILFIQEVCINLDERCKWEDNPIKRLVQQLLFGGLIPFILTYCYYWLLYYLSGKDIDDYFYIRHMFSLIITLNTMCTLYYFTKSFRENYKTTVEGKNKTAFRDYFIIPNGLDKVKIDIIDIAYLYRNDRNIYLCTFTGVNYVIWQSLDQIQSELNPNIFFRINRTHIISKKAVVKSIRNPKKGRDITLTPDRKVETSREKTADFEIWIK